MSWYRELYPGFTITCNKCGSKQVLAQVEDGEVILTCLDCRARTAIRTDQCWGESYPGPGGSGQDGRAGDL